MSDKREIKPDCFKDLDTVFPVKENGLRETPPYCMYECPFKTECLKAAMTTEKGMAVEEEILDRGTRAGVINFFERWSRKKQMHRRTGR